MFTWVEARRKTRLMIKFIFPLFFFFFFHTAYAQDLPLTAEEKASLDSLFKNDAFFNMLNEKQDTSYAELSAGLSNGVFSIKNNALNAAQASVNKIYYTPAAGYFHKSGFSISATGYLASEYNSLKFFQYAISPGYSFYSKKINWAASYSRYIKAGNTDFDINPYKNDMYGNIVFKKPWIRPAIGVGYSSGREKEFFDSVVTFGQVPRTITIRDTITSRVSSFSLNFSVSHTWSFEHVLFLKDELDMKPFLYANGSNQRLLVAHSGSLNNRRPVVQQLLKSAYGDGNTKEKFSLQSLAFLFELNYGKGKFIIQPQLYLDYYLQDTDSKRFSALYSFVISYAF